MRNMSNDSTRNCRATTHCSQRERKAMEAEHNTMLKLRFMEDERGEVYEGIITGVAQFGFFVQLRELFVEGLVHVSALTGDYYHYIEKLHCLRGERKKCAMHLRLCVDPGVDTIRKRIDFSLERE